VTFLMTGTDSETGKRIRTPHIEIGSGYEPSFDETIFVNTETLSDCFGSLIPPGNQRGADIPDYPFYSVFKVMSRFWRCPDCGECNSNLEASPFSRTLIGYLEESVLKEKLPKAYKELEMIEDAYAGGAMDYD